MKKWEIEKNKKLREGKKAKGWKNGGGGGEDAKTGVPNK